jgi:arylsulfatase A-like enzyme
VGSRPDIVLLMTDQQRHDQVGFSGNGLYETPHLDALAADGVIFADAYSSASTCIPARIGLLTGVQARRLPKQWGTPALQEGVWTIAHGLRAAGYDTALIGKMHFTPMHAQHGFTFMRTAEHLVASVHALRPDGGPDLDDYHQWLVDEGVARWGTFAVGEAPQIIPNPRPHPGTTAFPYELEYHPTSWIEREVRGYLAARRSDRPLFLVVSFPHPHEPHNPPEPYASRYDEADITVPRQDDAVNADLPDVFASALRGGTPRFPGWRVAEHGEPALRTRLTKIRALVRQIDDVVGRLLELLPRDRTVVAFTSDHGDFAGHRGLASKVPWIPFDDLLRVPLVVAGPGIAEGRTVDALVQSSDLPLTFCDLAGVEYPAPIEALDSLPLTRWFAAHPAPADTDRAALFISNLGWPGVRVGPLKLIRHQKSGQRVVFDLAIDPAEMCNRADDPQYRERVDDLDARLDAALERGAPPQNNSGTCSYG